MTALLAKSQLSRGYTHVHSRDIHAAVYEALMSSLQVLDLGGNFISHLPDGLGALKSLESIHLGSVIDELERRNFQNGNWLWSLPDSFGRLESLRYANLDENQLEGLPSNFGDLVHLEWLDLGEFTRI